MLLNSLLGALLLTLPWLSVQAANTQAFVANGKALEAELKARYESTVTRCDEAPAFKCSGVILRGTRQNLPDQQGAWEPWPVGRTLDTSFSYVRADIRMSRLAWNYSNGFIITPPTELSVNCFYPVDGVSDERSDNGCGTSRKQTAEHFVCDIDLPASLLTAPVTPDYLAMVDRAASLWISLDVLNNADPLLRCAYPLTGSFATQRFEIGLMAAARASQTTDKPNDLKIQTWRPGYDPRLPIAAFFYINEQGKPFARRDRDQYEALSRIRLPIIKMTFPDDSGGSITFEFVDM